MAQKSTIEVKAPARADSAAGHKAATEVNDAAHDMSAAQTQRELGRKGEEAAAVFLQNLGQRIVMRNWRCRFGEVDLITQDGDTFVFCEVKTRKSVRAGQPAEAITIKKQRKYSLLAALWLSRFQEGECAVRFDVVSIVVLGPHRARLTLTKDAFGQIEGL